MGSRQSSLNFIHLCKWSIQNRKIWRGLQPNFAEPGCEWSYERLQAGLVPTRVYGFTRHSVSNGYHSFFFPNICYSLIYVQCPMLTGNLLTAVVQHTLAGISTCCHYNISIALHVFRILRRQNISAIYIYCKGLPPVRTHT